MEMGSERSYMCDTWPAYVHLAGHVGHQWLQCVWGVPCHHLPEKKEKKKHLRLRSLIGSYQG